MGYISVAVAVAMLAGEVTEDMDCDDILFENTHQKCRKKKRSVIDGCLSLDEDKFYCTESESIEPYCTINWEVIACMETALCYCNYSAGNPVLADGYYNVAYVTYYHNYISDCGNATYGESIGSDVIRPIEETPGVDCSQYNIAVGDLALVMTEDENPDVIELAKTCEGILGCYRRFDEEAGEALYRQDLFTACTSAFEMIECAVRAICACGHNLDDDFIDWVHDERHWWRSRCDIVFHFPETVMYGITCPIHPSQPTHNCSGPGDFIPENGTDPCVCTSHHLGTPPVNLVWLAEDGTVLEAGSNGITELQLPPEFLTRAYDHTQLVCKAVGPVTSKSVALPLSIAYGPDTVDLQVYRGCEHGDQPFVLLHCDMGEMNPLSPDMVQWLGACEDQQGGFTCRVDPSVLNTAVGCRVINRYNNNRTVDSKKIEFETSTTETNPTATAVPQTKSLWGVRWTVVGSLTGAAVALTLGCLITAYFCRKRRKRAQERPADPADRRRPVALTDTGHPVTQTDTGHPVTQTDTGHPLALTGRGPPVTRYDR